MCHKCILKTNNKQGYKKVFWLYNTRDNKWIIDTRHINQSARPIPKVHRRARAEMNCDLVLACCNMLYFFGKKTGVYTEKPLNCGFFIWHITLYSVLTTRT